MPNVHVRDAIVEKDGQVRVSGLPLRQGDHVQVVVIPRVEPVPGPGRYPLRGQPVEYSQPFEPATEPEEWEANR